MLSPLHVARWTLGGTFAVIAGLAASAEPLAPMAPQPQSALMESVSSEALRLVLTSAELTSASLEPEIEVPSSWASQPAPVVVRSGASVRPEARPDFVAEARWDGRDQAQAWSLAAMRAISGAPHDLRDVVPADISDWCPGYLRNPPHLRAAFWVGTISALARYESNFDPRAQGGNGSWHGLLQILPATARGYGCEANSASELHDGEANLECAVRIMSVTVSRDNVIAAGGDGIAADWGPMANPTLREKMRTWVRDQSYCEVPTAVMASLRPLARPDDEAVVAEADTRPDVDVPTSLSFLAWN